MDTMRKLWPLCLLVCACEARVGLPANDIDANPTADGPTLGQDSPSCVPRVVFLQFEGQALSDAPTSDSTQNQASWMTIPNGTAPPYHAGSATRAADIQAIVDGVTAQLSGFPITVVTTRPTSGNYIMIVYGGNSGQVGSNFGGAVQELDCGDTTPNDVAWVSDGVNPTQRIVNFSVGAIGFGLGLTATVDPTDCMCGWDNNCTSNNTAACNLTEGIARDPAARQLCQGAPATQDETSTFRAAFCL